MWRAKCSWLGECGLMGRRQGLVLLLLPCTLLLTLYLMSSGEPIYNRLQYLAFQKYNGSLEEAMDGYLVWNPKCHMLSKYPLDPSIVQFVKREKFQACSSDRLLTGLARLSNGSLYLAIDPDAAKRHVNLNCCWSPITRPPVLTGKLASAKDFDSRVSVGECKQFTDHVVLPRGVEALMVTCKSSGRVKSSRRKVKSKAKIKKPSSVVVYENVHAVVDPERVRARLNSSEFREFNNSAIPDASGAAPRAHRARDLSVLVLGIDSVSRLNFHRSMPLTRSHLDEQGWIDLRGYNKMGDNTFPNLMAILTGQNQTLAYSKCSPVTPYGLDNCSLIWYNFREAGYVTAYGEDTGRISTFNYLKVGFVDPPTDYYLRPYILAAEKLKSKQRFGFKYCTGPELAFDRIFNYAVDFAKAFINVPYFGFFWTNSMSHENMNGPSSIDEHFLAKIQDMESAGVMNDSMLILLSDHGMRYGDMRSTFMGWYEERLPTLYIWLPEWFREENPEAYHSLRINQNRLTSPYDLHETLKDIVVRAGGQAVSSSGCVNCNSLFKPIPYVRSCRDAGIAPHWCTCAGFEITSSTDKIVIEGANKFVQHMDNIVQRYTSPTGTRLCSKLKLKKIIRVHRVMDLDKNSDGSFIELFYLLEVTPGDGLFETTIQYHGPNNFTINDQQVSRINSYAHSAKCLDEGYKLYCHCT